MGQYYIAVNLDKRQKIEPHAFNDGAKLMEFASAGGGMMTGLALLLANGNGRGGGDCRSCHPIIGSWAGDRVVIVGDYADADQFGTKGDLYSSEEIEDISQVVILAVQEDTPDFTKTAQ